MVCGHPGCANLIPCEDHRRIPWERHSKRSNLSGSKQQKRARRVIRSAGGICAVCGSAVATEADHVVPLGEGGPDTAENMQGFGLSLFASDAAPKGARGRRVV
jgi:5-methylcytosine-specific restriction protein A